MFQLSNIEAGITIGAVKYDFSANFTSTNAEQSQMNHLTRGGSGKSKVGLIYTEGNASPDVATTVLSGADASVLIALQNAFKNRTRIDLYIIDPVSNWKRFYKNAVIQKMPRQLAIAEGADSMNIEVIVESFDVDEEVV